MHHEDHTNSPNLGAAEAVCQSQEASGVHSQTLAVNGEINEDNSHNIDDDASQDLEPQTAEMPTESNPVEEADQACKTDGHESNESSMTDKRIETQTLTQQSEPESFCVTAAEQMCENERKEHTKCSVDSEDTDNEAGTDLMNTEALQPSTSIEREEACTVSNDDVDMASEQPLMDETRAGRNAIDLELQPENTIASLTDDLKTTVGHEQDENAESLKQPQEVAKESSEPNSQSGAIEAMEIDLPKTQAGTLNTILLRLSSARDQTFLSIEQNPLS